MGKLAVFIDADNFCDNTALDAAMKAIQLLDKSVLLKHAYGNASSLRGIEASMAKYGIRPISNLMAGKTTTDIALAIGAMEAVCRNAEVKVVVICSGDADFAPLALRLREMGCHVICVGRKSNLFSSASAFYDEVLAIDTKVELAPEVAAKTTHSVPVVSSSKAGAAGTAAPLMKPSPSAPAPSLAKTSVVPAAKAQSSVKVSAVAASEKAKNALLERVLTNCSQLRDGQWHPLGTIVQQLRAANVLAKNAKAVAWFAQLAPYMRLQPVGKPHQICFKQPAPRNKDKVKQATPAKSRPALASPESTHAVIKPFPATARSWDIPKRQKPIVLPAPLNALRMALVQVAAQRVSVADIVLAVPELISADACSYRCVMARLHERGLVLPSQSILRVLLRHPHSFRFDNPAAPQALVYVN